MLRSPATRQLAAHLRPRRAAAEARRIVAKWRRRLARTDSRVVTLEPTGAHRGEALLSYIIDGLLLPPGAPMPHGHTHFWESTEIARSLADLGFRVDVIGWRNRGFVLRKPYAVAIDVRLNLEHWVDQLPPRCLKIFHGETCHWTFNNSAQQARLQALRERRGIEVRPCKLVEPNRAIESADCGFVLGNEMSLETYRFADKPLTSIPISTPLEYPELERDWERARRRFLWFGSGGLVHKGLDLVLEAFAKTPELELTVCGPIHQERDFERAYFRELYDLPNIHTLGWIDIASDAFTKLARATGAVVYPSCSEAGGGAMITCMHAGIIPVLASTSSVTLDPAYGVELGEASVTAVRAAVSDIASRPAAELAAMSRAARGYVREHHTRARFAAAYRETLSRALEDAEARR